LVWIERGSCLSRAFFCRLSVAFDIPLGRQVEYTALRKAPAWGSMLGNKARKHANENILRQAA
jgi:hypothetical protein